MQIFKVLDLEEMNLSNIWMQQLILALGMGLMKQEVIRKERGGLGLA